MEHLTGRKYLWRVLMSLPFFVLLGASPVQARTFYVSALIGDDSNTFAQAQNPATPWATLEKASEEVDPGDVVIVMPGTYTETLEPRSSNTTWRAVPPRQAIIEPNNDQGVVVDDGTTGVIIEGFVIDGGTTGIRFEEADNGAIRNNEVRNAQFNGITVKDSDDVAVEDNEVHDSGGNGVNYDGGSDPVVHNNLVHHNGGHGIVTDTDSGDVQVTYNTVDSSGISGVRIEGSTTSGQVTSNIISNSGTTGLTWKSTSLIEGFNDSWGNGGDNFNPSPPAFSSISADPLYVAGYHLSQQPEQGTTSPCVNSGDPNDPVNGTTSTGNRPDADPPDMGYHYPLVQSTMDITLTKAKTTVAKKNGKMKASYKVEGWFDLGPSSDGINPAKDGIEIILDASSTTTTAAKSCNRNGNIWKCKRKKKSGEASIIIDLAQGSFVITASNVPAFTPPMPTNVRLGLAIGGDAGEAEFSYVTGSLAAP